MEKLSPRQVHLDFHTSPLIPEVGKNFSKENFQKALKEGHLSSITVFAKCHHSQCYYPTKVGTMHPGLDFDLLGAEIEAAHEIGVRAPIYITAGWSAEDAKNHPEWLAHDRDGKVTTRNYDSSAPEDSVMPNCCWLNLCLNDGSYCQHIYELTREICARYPMIDGLFYDIMFNQDVCYCDECKAGMRALGLDPENETDAKAYFDRKHIDFMGKCREILDTNNPEATLFFNSGGADPYRPQYHCGSTHFELEDLPTAWGGYDKMPPTAKYFANTGKDFMGMTGKFHTEWGEFGGFKTGEALRFEAAAMMTYGARCSVGDQMHPDGEMDLSTYQNIGAAYEYVEKIEEYCLDGTQTTRLGLYLSDDPLCDEGAEKLLLETQNDFDIVYQNNFDPFEIVVFPDCVKLNEAGKSALSAYLARGGKVLFTGDSLIEGGKFLADPGARPLPVESFRQDYVRALPEIGGDMVASPLLFYTSGKPLEITNGTILSEIYSPYFDRTYGHYCSHRNTPYDKSAPRRPGAVRYGNVVYLAHRICEMYRQYGAIYHRRYFRNCLALLQTDPVLTVPMMSGGRVSLTRQADKSRYCLNLLYASPIKRGIIEVIDDLPTLYQIPVAIRAEEKITRVYCPADGLELPFIQQGNRVTFTVPELQTHRLTVLEYQG